ncbi:helix-turn-helix domain-containing protein [Streptomyces sp. A7024]|uniref:Helix-turn-helix domain-containing protein n=1 Tax=Streptomyces coryli TaxID=1128680 RepID=A0A6G4UDZ5_9ACTN|nr:helix-turn-helix domain-containing protein [Streptomyces coryli]NGN70242.1 helix-turn-helix domain-containing protein [Streptomyces coryli]
MPQPASKRSVVRLTDPGALRALSHRTRMELVGLLRVEGPFTATRAAELTGESVASCSYHLRMLAKYGLVEEAEGGRGREKPWRATARYTSWADTFATDDEATVAAADVLNTAVAERYFERFSYAVETRRQLPAEWREAEWFGDDLVYLTAAELTDLTEKMTALFEPYADRVGDPSRRPAGAELVSVLRIAFRDRRYVPGVRDAQDAQDAKEE